MHGLGLAKVLHKAVLLSQAGRNFSLSQADGLIIDKKLLQVGMTIPHFDVDFNLGWEQKGEQKESKYQVPHVIHR